MMRRIGWIGASSLALGLVLAGCQSKPAETYLAPAARSGKPPPGRPEALDMDRGAATGMPASAPGMPQGRPGPLGGQ
jgi:hypothetical protein